MYNKNKEGSHVHKARVSERGRGRKGGTGEKEGGVQEKGRERERERQSEREGWGVGGKREFKVSIN